VAREWWSRPGFAGAAGAAQAPDAEADFWENPYPDVTD
jgi:hypothetical protein